MSEPTIGAGDVAAQLAAAQAENDRLVQQLADQDANARYAALRAENDRLAQQLAVEIAPAAAPAAPAAPTPQMSADDAAEIATLRAQVERMMAQLTAMGAAAVAAPEPRFKSVFDLFRELAARSLGSDVLHEFLAVVDRLDEEANPTEPTAPQPVGAAAGA